MNELVIQAEIAAGPRPAAHPPRVTLDGRRPRLLDHRGNVLQVVAGHADLFAVVTGSDGSDGTESARHYLFSVERGELILDFPGGGEGAKERVRVIAVGSPGAEASVIPRDEIENIDLVANWIGWLAKVIAGPHPSWAITEADNTGMVELAPGERRRGPARTINWISVKTGMARLMGQEPGYRAGDPPVPLVSGIWVEAADFGMHAGRRRLANRG